MCPKYISGKNFLKNLDKITEEYLKKKLEFKNNKNFMISCKCGFILL